MSQSCIAINTAIARRLGRLGFLGNVSHPAILGNKQKHPLIGHRESRFMTRVGVIFRRRLPKAGIKGTLRRRALKTGSS